MFAYTEQRLIQINNHYEKCKYMKFSCQKFWWFKKKSYLCIRFRERTKPQAKRDYVGVTIALKKEFFEKIYIRQIK